MRGYEAAMIIAVLSLLILASDTSAQYWFQSGIRASQNYSQNQGASVSIETIYPQNLQYGSFGFWVGELLSNGAFIQVGYEIPNQTGYYPTNCTASGSCTGKVLIKKGYPSWFWEYFPPGNNSTNFYGSIGPNDSVGANGTFNTYSFRYSNGLWNIYINRMQIGSVNLGTSSSGLNVPTVFGEYANTNNNNTYMKPVTFSNLTVYKNGIQESVSHGYTYIGYGAGSEKNMMNTYGVKEISPYVNRFEVGSGLPTPLNFTTLWSYGYTLKINSDYGSRGYNEFSPYSEISLAEPEYVYLSNNTREKFVGWIGSSLGSYTGSLNSTSIIMSSNITETAVWETQYLLNISGEYTGTTGSGWYMNGTVANIRINATNVTVSNGTRYHFEGFNNEINSTSENITVSKPEYISAVWAKQYFVNATTMFGNVSGSGWYTANSTAVLKLSKVVQPINQDEEMLFSSWSNGYANSTIKIKVNSSIDIYPIFTKAFKVKINPYSETGSAIRPEYFYYSGNRYNTTTVFLPSGSGTFGYFYFNGVNITPSNPNIFISSPGNVNVTLPVYNVTIYTRNIFGSPISGTLFLSFQNGTKISKHTGPNGSVAIPNVPYGNISGIVSYSGFTAKINSDYSSTVEITMLTPGVIVGIAIVTIAVASFWFYMQFRNKKKR
jgi:hypothetical protein